MKKQFRSLLALLLVIVTILALVACAKVSAEGKWENATYLSDKSFGKGAITIALEVKVEEQSVTFTVHTDKENLADALLEHGLIEGEMSTYGLYVKKVNGITADYDVDSSWWNLQKDGVDTLGASSVTIADGEHYEFVYQK